MCVRMLSVALGKEFTGLLEKQEGMSYSGSGRVEGGGGKEKSTERPPGLHNQAGNMQRTETMGRHALTVLMTLSSEAFHFSSRRFLSSLSCCVFFFL